MERQIKFRAWNKTKSVMLSAGDVGECQVKVLGKSHVYDTGATPDEYEWMQFTGLTDKNGKDVFEGDILTWEYEPDDKYVVRWERAALEAFNHEGRYLTGRSFSSTEIIGNIYENPNLLSV